MEDKYAKKRFDTLQENAIDTGCWRRFPLNIRIQGRRLSYETDEFTAVCPWTGLPDFAKLIIKYVPESSLVELKSLKYYLTSYRNVGILQEHAVNRILKDLVALR